MLSSVSGSPFFAGVNRSGIVCTPTKRFVYVTDFAQNELIAYSVVDNSALNPLINGPFKTGSQPDAITIDTTSLDADQVFERASELIARYIARPG